jgi:nitrate/TMAO reductase-like tetraheme cytochrome c subunit
MARYKLRHLVYNKISLGGIVLASVTLVIALFFMIAEGGSGHVNPYMGIVTYMILPPFVVIGLLLIPFGMIRRSRYISRGGKVDIPEWPRIDFNTRSHRRGFLLFLLGFAVFGIFSAFASYQAYHHTESVAFCGETCHEVMKPEHVAYQGSSHARVPCTSCHVGAGASWYVRSKLSGAYQVYATALNKYPRPIPTPIHNLRPAQETCEKCHWPKKFFGAQQRQLNHYMYDEENTHWPINMLIKTGGGDPKTGQQAGIHWHMNIGTKVEYIARDERRQDIGWIRVTDRTTGRVTVYHNEDDPMSEEDIAASEKRVMDCMDCHNRPSHKYLAPDYTVDRAILTGRVDHTLPEIKRVAVEAMDHDYETEDDALEQIAVAISDFYHDEYPEVFKERRVQIDDAIVAVQEEFARSIFPEMKVKWSEYPDNIGHFIFPGCMRCHSGNMVSEEGWTITRDCTACHTILSQGSGDRFETASGPEGLEFVHPDEDVGDEWRETNCYECHEGVQP